MAGLLAFPLGAGAEDTILRLDPAQKSQIHDGVFEGWGTSLCWWANRLGYSDTLARMAAEAFCDPVHGLGLNILRYNIGGGDDPEHSHITRTDSMIPGYWQNPRYDEDSGTWLWDYDWEQDRNQRNVLEKCLACGTDMIVEAFSNSPPYFLTNSGCSSGARRAFQDNLRSDAYEAFALYLTDVAEHFEKEWNIPFQSISPMNEPDTSYWGAGSSKQEGCHFDPGTSQSRMLLCLARSLEERGLDIVLAGTDETSIDTQALSLSRLTPEALSVLDRVDTHTYGGSNREFLRSQVLKAGKNLWMSEVDGGDTLGQNAGEMGAALWLSQRICDDLNGLTPSAWVLWQIIDSHICHDGYLGRKDTGMVNVGGGYWGCAVADHDREELILTMKYYALGQFTRFIRPGSRLIRLSGSAAAALDGDGNLVLVLVHSGGDEKTVRVDLSAFDFFPAGSVVEAFRTSGSMAEGEHWKELEPLSTDESGFTAALIPCSVTTFRVMR